MQGGLDSDPHPTTPNLASGFSLKAADLISPRTLQLTVSRENASTDLRLSLTSQQSVEFTIGHLDHMVRFSQIESSYKKKPESRPLSTRITVFSSPSHAFLPILDLELLWATGIEGDEGVHPRSAIAALERDILSYYFPPVVPCDMPWNIQTFYESVHVPSKHSTETPDMPDHLLNCKLYPFQRRSVQWLLQREAVKLSEGKVSPLENRSQCSAPLFEPAFDWTQRRCFVSHLRRMVLTNLDALSEDEVGGRRGILAEEMGLGKTVELTALISLHRRKIEQPTVYDPYTDAEVATSGATLIITPPGILEQWRTELNNHAPHLQVFHYKGMPSVTASKKHNETDMVKELLGYDVVLTTYNTLSREIHYTNTAPKRDLRKAKQHEPRRSPIVQISWWRCCLDEAQMIESGVSQAATVARVIPRVNAWAISGTPVRKNVQDLLGLLVFLRLEPFCSAKSLWNSLDRETFKEIFSTIALRHTKDQVRDELRLPPQKRIVMLLPFTPIEEQNYTQLLQQLCEDCGLSPEGIPKGDGFDPDDARTVEKMRMWLSRLRQTCLHPQVGGRNRRALGRGNAPLRTVEEVLDVMIEQNDTAVRAEEREHVLAQVVRGHIFGFAKNDVQRSPNALKVYSAALKQAEGFVNEARHDVAEEEARLRAEGNGALKNATAESESDSESDSENKDSKRSSRLATLRKALRSALEVYHICTFYVASAYYQVKTDEGLTKPDSDTFQEVEQRETEYYEKAKATRKELLQECHSRAERVMRKIKAQAKVSDQILQLPL